MNYFLLGQSGLRVSELSLGTMTFGEDWGWGASREESKKIYDAYLAAGGNFIDTANKYTDGTSEKYLGDFIAAERSKVVLATKFSLSVREGDPNAHGNHRKNMVQAVEESLKRLKTDYIDLYWLHAWDFTTSEQEVMRALDDLVRAGKILYIGISDTPAWIVSRANTLAELQGWTSFCGLQIEYSLIERTPERDLLPMANALDLAVLAWSPLGSGLLSGKYSTKKKPEEARLKEGSDRFSKRNLRIADEVIKIAAKTGFKPAQIALNWLRQAQGVIIPIIGALSLTQFQENLGCLNFKLTESQIRRLDKASKIELGFPHDFLAAPKIQNIIYGGTQDFLINHRRSPK